MTERDKIVDLRRVLAERFPQVVPGATPHFATGISSFDQALGGGFPQGAITELTSPNSSAGSAYLIAQFLEASHRAGNFLALIDGCDSFDPAPLGNERLRNLLWVRCRKAIEAVKASDFLLRDGNFSFVILDLVLNPAGELQKIPATHWYRLQRLVEPTSTAFLILTRRSMISSAQLKLVLENQWTLADLEEEPAANRLQIRVMRTHGVLYRHAGAG